VSAASVTVLETGPLVTVQDGGRPGQAALGIGRSGACDRASYGLANRLVGNDEDAAVLEVTFGGLTLHADDANPTALEVVSTGARCPGAPHNAPQRLLPGEKLSLGQPESGLRTYVAVRGGIDVNPVLGSRATDVLSGLGPDPVSAGDRLPIGMPRDPMPGVRLAPVRDPEADDVWVHIGPGPRQDCFDDDSWQRLISQRFTVSSDSNRVGIRLEGEPLTRVHHGELPSEGMVRGALQIPPAGTPVLFLADHPITGGYPVIAYVQDADVDRCAQLQPGQGLHFTTARA